MGVDFLTRKRVFWLSCLSALSLLGLVYFENHRYEKKSFDSYIAPNPPPILLREKIILTQTDVKTAISTPAINKLADETKKLNYDDDWCNYSELSEESGMEADMEHEDWMISRGHFSGQFNGYEAYSVEQLRELGTNGDLRALYALVYIKETDRDLKHWAAKNAAVYGGTGLTMAYISTGYAREYSRLLAENKNVEAKKALLESLAWNEFAAMRGDFIHLEMGIYIVGQEVNGVEITENDLSRISTKAKQIYRNLQSTRMDKGLGDFDSDLPKIIKQKNEWAIASMLSKGWRGWGRQYLVSSECVNNNILKFSKKT